MPMADLAVVKYSSPVFALILGRVLLGERIGAVKAAFCVLITAGNLMVVRPPIIFGSHQESQRSLGHYTTNKKSFILDIFFCSKSV